MRELVATMASSGRTMPRDSRQANSIASASNARLPNTLLRMVASAAPNTSDRGRPAITIQPVVGNWR